MDKFIQILMVIFFFQATATKAQNFSGKAIYKSAFQVAEEISISGNKSFSETQKDEMIAAIQKAMEKDYELNFTLTESNWKELPSLGNKPAASTGGITLEIKQSGGILYKNVQKTTYIQEDEVMGKAFLIQDKLKPKLWKLHNEYKQIGQYKCQKASFSETRTRNIMTMHNDEIKTETKVDTITTVAWFATEIPVSNGPELFWGLPGLIMQVTSGERTLICTSLTLNPKEGVEIDIPKKGKKVTQDDFEAIQSEKVKQMQEQYRGNDGDGFSIVISN